MQKIITKYGLAVHLAVLAVASLFLSESAILWVAALVAACVIMEPSRVGDEMLHDARRRVVRKILRDPLFWVSLVLLVTASIRTLNSGVALVYDAEAAKWSISQPHQPILPGSVDGVGLWHFVLAVVSVVIVIGCRQALGRWARSAFSLTAAAIAGVVSLVRLVSCHAKVESLIEISACPSTEPVYEGCAYGVFFLLSLTALATVFERRWWKSLPLGVIGICGTALGLFFFAPPQEIALFAVAGLVMLLYVFVYLRIKISKTADFRCLVVISLALAFAVMIAMTLAPDSLLQEKVAPFLSREFLPPGFLSARETLSGISFDIWRAHPWLGTGLGSFPIDLGMQARPADWKVISSLQTLPLNGYWLLLAERGVVGAFLLTVPLVILMVTYVRRLIGGIRTLPEPLALSFPLLLVVSGLGMLIDCSFLSLKALVPLLAVFSISANAFAKENGRNVK